MFYRFDEGLALEMSAFKLFTKLSRVAFLRSVIGQEKLRHYLIQSDARLSTECDLVSRVFPRFSLLAFTLSYE